MGIRYRKEQQARVAIDKSSFIGMEVEHSNDTSGKIRDENQKAIDVSYIKGFSRDQQKSYKNLRLEAY